MYHLLKSKFWYTLVCFTITAMVEAGGMIAVTIALSHYPKFQHLDWAGVMYLKIVYWSSYVIKVPFDVMLCEYILICLNSNMMVAV